MGTLSWFTITGAVVGMPSNILISCFPMSGYETKLWTLKDQLIVDEKDRKDVRNLYEDFRDINLRYSYTACMSKVFKKSVNVVLNNKEKIVDDRYDHFIRSSVDYELIRYQPVRYMWNEYNKMTISGLFLTTGLGFFSILKKDNGSKSLDQHLLKRFFPLKTVTKLVTCKKVVSKIPARFKLPIITYNFYNFGYYFDGYSIPEKEDG